jgi:hypothetical protein
VVGWSGCARGGGVKRPYVLDEPLRERLVGIPVRVVVGVVLAHQPGDVNAVRFHAQREAVLVDSVGDGDLMGRGWGGLGRGEPATGWR